MSGGDDRRQTPGRRPGEEGFVLRLRIAAGAFMLLCIGFLIVVGQFSGRIDSTVVGLLIGAVVTLVFEVPKRLGNGGDK